MVRWTPIQHGYEVQFNRGKFQVLRAPDGEWSVHYAGQSAKCGKKLDDALAFAEAQAGQKASRDFVVEAETMQKLAEHFTSFGIDPNTANFTVNLDKLKNPNLHAFRSSAAKAQQVNQQVNQTAEDAQMNEEIARKGKEAYDAVMTLKSWLYAGRDDRAKMDAEAAKVHAEKEVRDQWAAKRAKRAADAAAANKAAQEQNKTQAQRNAENIKKAQEAEAKRQQEEATRKKLDDMERLRRFFEDLMDGKFQHADKQDPPPPPPPADTKRKRYWHEVLGFPPNGPYDKDAVKKQYRKLAMTHHPDHPELGGSNEKMAELNDAWEVAKKILGIV